MTAGFNESSATALGNQASNRKRQEKIFIGRLKRVKLYEKYSCTEGLFRGMGRDCMQCLLAWGGVSRKQVDLPTITEFLHLIHQFFPLRAGIAVDVCDFGDGQALCNSIKLVDVEHGTKQNVCDLVNFCA